MPISDTFVKRVNGIAIVLPLEKSRRFASFIAPKGFPLENNHHF
jgi:hypothetical protein